MYRVQTIQFNGNLSTPRSPMRQMSILPIKPPAPMGCAPNTRSTHTLKSAIHHAYLLPGEPNYRSPRTQTQLPEIHQALRQKTRSTTLLRLSGIWYPIRTTPLSRYLFWCGHQTRTAYARLFRQQKPLRPSRPQHSGLVGPRVNLCKGLQLIEPHDVDYKLRSRLYFERQMEQKRFIESGMGPHVQDSLHRQTSSEIALRKVLNRKRRTHMLRFGYDPELFLPFRSTLPNASPNTERSRGIPWLPPKGPGQ